MDSETILSIKDLKVHYVLHDSTVEAVNGVTMDIRRGETLGLAGETGAGKTTVALSILNLLPYPPARIMGGEVLLEGRDILKMPDKEIRKVRGNKVSMIFQDPMTALNPVDKVGDQIVEGILLHEKISRSDAVKKACDIMEEVGIPADRFDEYPLQFSGGMKQRIVIAMALVCRPDLLIADEPTTARDVTIQAQVLNMVEEIREQRGTSMLLITHDLGILAEMCDRVAIMYAGEIVEMGTIEQIYDETKHPYTKGLFRAIPTLDTKSERLEPIPGLMPDPSNLPKGCSFCPRCNEKLPVCETMRPISQDLGDGHLVSCHLFSRV